MKTLGYMFVIRIKGMLIRKINYQKLNCDEKSKKVFLFNWNLLRELTSVIILLYPLDLI